MLNIVTRTIPLVGWCDRGVGASCARAVALYRVWWLIDYSFVFVISRVDATFYSNLHLTCTRTYPLNLSISLSGGKETNLDSPSSGERRGTSSYWKSMACHWVVVFIHCASGRRCGKPFGKRYDIGWESRVRIAPQMVLCIGVSLFESRVITGGSFHQRLNIYEVFDSKEVPWGNIAKYSEKRVKQNWNRLEVSGWTKPLTEWDSSRFRRAMASRQRSAVIRLQLRSWLLLPAPSGMRGALFTCPVLKHGPRSLACMRVRGN